MGRVFLKGVQFWVQDLTKDVVRIDAIESQSLDTIRARTEVSSCCLYSLQLNKGSDAMPLLCRTG